MRWKVFLATLFGVPNFSGSFGGAVEHVALLLFFHYQEALNLLLISLIPLDQTTLIFQSGSLRKGLRKGTLFPAFD